MGKRKKKRTGPECQAGNPPAQPQVELPVEAAPTETSDPAPRVAVIVVTYNSRLHLADLLGSLRAQTHRAWELIVVDSNSADDTREWLARHAPAARVIASPHNLGYRRGNQMGIDAAAKPSAGSDSPLLPDYLLVLNDDVELHPAAIERMVAVAESSPKVGVVAPAILVYGSANRLNAAGSSLLPSGFYSARGKDRKYGQYAERAQVAAASGCCFLYRRTLFELLGAFDAIFDSLPGGWHASAEDLDLCWRVWRAGFTVEYEPCALLWHKYEQRPMHAARYGSLVAGRLAFVALNSPRRQLLLLAPLLLGTEIALGVYSLVRGPRFLRAWLDGYHWLWGNRRRLRELRGLRAARSRAGRQDLTRLMQPSIRLAPAVECHPVFGALALLWLGVNAASLLAMRAAELAAGSGGRT